MNEHAFSVLANIFNTAFVLSAAAGVVVLGLHLRDRYRKERGKDQPPRD